jgi:hypothetical protein
LKERTFYPKGLINREGNNMLGEEERKRLEAARTGENPGKNGARI